MKVLGVVGARPNFIKMDPLFREMGKYPETFSLLLVHTGQHYDDSMSGAFFRELGLREPDINLGVGSGTHAQQTAGVMLALEPVIAKHKPGLVLVVGDVNSTAAAALTAAKMNIPVAHVESGLRCYDQAIPEEINRVQG